jgi:AcrR family transcriptional regulator
VALQAVHNNPGKGERTAARIRDVALDHFSRLGFERATLAEIARSAGVSQPSLHYYFADKAQLWRSAMADLGAAIAEEERAAHAVRDATPLVQLRMAMRLFLALSWRYPALGRIVALEGMAGGERLEWLIDTLMGRRNARLVALVRAAIAEGTLKAFPPEQLVITLQAAAVGIINLAPLLRASFGIDPDTPQARAVHETMIVDAILGGLTVTQEGLTA